MSLEAIGWVLRDAPDVPSQCVSVLVGLADHADKRGRGAYPSAGTLATYTRKSERQVRYDLSVLAEAKLIRLGDQSEVAKYPVNRRPVVYDLAMERTRKPGVQPIAPLEAELGVQSASGVQPIAPQQPIAPLEADDLQEQLGVQPIAPLEIEFQGCNAAQPGVQPTADKPSMNLKSKTSSRRKRDLNEGRPEIERLCAHLADRVEANGSLRPSIGKKWHDAARLMLDADGRSEAQAHKAIDWCQGNEFWRKNVMSMPKLRSQYDRLRMEADDERKRLAAAANGHAATGESTATQRARAGVEAGQRVQAMIDEGTASP